MSEKIVLIDGNSILNRAYFGLPDLTNGEGIHTNAIYGFLNTMFKIIDDEKPDYMAVAFDLHAATFRHKVYKEYKAGRAPMQEELKQQFPLIKDLLRAMNISILEQEGLEADDILGTIARMGEKLSMDVTIVTGDRDLLQIATDTTKIILAKTVKGKSLLEAYFAKDVLEKYKVTPSQYIELKALKGDDSDNIPGLPKVGDKTAEKLMVEFGSIDNIYANLDKIKGNAIRNSVENNRELLDLCLFLVTIKTDEQLDFDIYNASIDDMFNEEAYNIFKRLELSKFYGKFQDNIGKNTKLFNDYKLVTKAKEYKELINKIKAVNKIGVNIWFANNDSFTESSGQMSLFELENDKKDYALSICFSDEDIYFLSTDDFTGDDIINLFKLCCSSEKLAFVYDVKKLYQYLDRENLSSTEGSKGLFDIMIAEYLINPLKAEYDISDISKDYLNILCPSYKQLFEKKFWHEAFISKRDEFIHYAVSFAVILFKAAELLDNKLKTTEMTELFRNIEMPLSYILYNMEKEGILVDKPALKEYAVNLENGLNELEEKIYDAAGEKFNINSPKQLSVILFEKMQLPGAKKTKTGYSTSADVLEKLAEDNPFVKDILEYRTLSKLKSTYADGLSAYIEADGRIRTTFNQTITATGRISSTEPNLQNIPMRMELGRSIRKVFIPKLNCKFVDADYSQIELRILAALSADKELIEAYKSGHDIHAITASKVFGVALEDVTEIQRRNAKAVNFGIVYGISSFGLGQDLSISREEASRYIKDYFASYTGIKDYLDNAKKSAKEKGYSVTLFNRRRPILELASSNFMQRAFGERVAMNAPIQGTAADIMKIAMIKVYDRLYFGNYRSRMILQVHDELVIEAYDDELEEVSQILVEEMGKAVELPVKLQVSCHSGANLYEAK